MDWKGHTNEAEMGIMLLDNGGKAICYQVAKKLAGVGLAGVGLCPSVLWNVQL